MTISQLLTDKFFIISMLVLILPFALIIFLAIRAKRSKTSWDSERKQLGIYGQTKEEFAEAHPDLTAHSAMAKKWEKFQVIGFSGIMFFLGLFFVTFIPQIALTLQNSLDYVRGIILILEMFFIGYAQTGKVNKGLQYSLVFAVLLIAATYIGNMRHPSK